MAYYCMEKMFYIFNLQEVSDKLATLVLIPVLQILRKPHQAFYFCTIQYRIVAILVLFVFRPSLQTLVCFL